MKLKKFAALCCAVSIFLPALPSARATDEYPDSVELPVLMYHHIVENPKSWGDYIVSPATFEGDMKYLSERGYETVSIQQLIDFAAGVGNLPEKPVMVTFDDGQRSFAEYAVPILEKYNMCAVAAIVGKYADTFTESGDTNVKYAYMSWGELSELNKNPCVELQAHTYDMHTLDSRRGCSIRRGESRENYFNTFGNDLRLEKERFEKYLGIKPIAFAYPYGIRCAEAEELLTSCGYLVTFSCDERVNTVTRDGASLHCLGRYNRPNGVDRYSYFSKMGIK